MTQRRPKLVACPKCGARVEPRGLPNHLTEACVKHQRIHALTAAGLAQAGREGRRLSRLGIPVTEDVGLISNGARRGQRLKKRVLWADQLAVRAAKLCHDDALLMTAWNAGTGEMERLIALGALERS